VRTALDPAIDVEPLQMPGLEPDNLLAFLAMLGLLRSIETARTDWRPRVGWKGPPWVAQLHLAMATKEMEVAEVANKGISLLVERFDVDGRKNVNFQVDDFRSYALRLRGDEVKAALAAALAAEWPLKKTGGVSTAPLVMMFGQGHQNFLDRLVDVPSGKLPTRFRQVKSPPDMRAPGNIAEALFQPWRRNDDADGFRWDPEDDQRYALRFDDPSGAGAALTVLGANRLAAVGFLSFPAAPALRQIRVVGATRKQGDWFFVWPIWRSPLSRAGIEALLAHPALLEGDRRALAALGVADIFQARRIANGKFMNVTRAWPVSG
jgi:hypothetical protein